MRCALCLFVGFVVALLSVPSRAQVESPQARELQAQMEAIQRRLEQLRREAAGDQKVTEIGSSRARPRAEGEPLVVRIYDLGDLYSIAPRYAAREPGDLQLAARAIFPDVERAVSASGGGGGSGGAGMGGMFAVPTGPGLTGADRAILPQAGGAMGVTTAESSRTSVDDLIDTITSTIQPQDWDDVGGPASITSLGSSLVVSASLDMHDQIGALLDLFRRRWGSLRTISLQAHWLWLTESELAGALSAAPQESPALTAYGALTDEAWKQLRALAAADANRRPGYHAVLSCYNGQTVHTLAGGQRVYVAGMTPVVGGDKSAGYQPQISVIQEGAALQVTPVATRTAKYVVADVHSRVNLLATGAAQAPMVEKASAAGEPAQVASSIDRPLLDSQRLSTTLRIPVGRPTLIGGMTFVAKSAADPNLYLFLTAHVQELRDDETTDEKLPGKEPDNTKPAQPQPPAAPKPD